jgi:hypothetical protein
MGLFGKILNKLGIKKDKAEASKAATMSEPTAKPATSAKSSVSAKSAPTRSTPLHHTKVASASSKSTPAPMEMVDVMSKLETMAEGTKLDWKVSIVDLLKVLDLDSSLSARKELATELGAPADVMADNVKMNVWLHKKVLAEIAENGGNIPQELLD